jgi:hypothetical protein
MSNNVYAAPRSNLDDHSHAALDDRFYVVSARKLLILTFATFGMYLLYWHFKNWSLHRRATGDSVWPVPRAIFSLFFTHSLFRRFANHDVTHKRGGWDSDSYATTMVLLMIIGYVLSWTGQGSLLFDVISLMLLIPTALLLKQVQLEVNARCGDPTGSSNDTFTVANVVWSLLGGVLWLFVILGLLLPTES